MPTLTLPCASLVAPTYITIHNVLRNPVYAGAFVYGKTRNECYVDEDGTVRERISGNSVCRGKSGTLFLPETVVGFTDWGV